MSVQMGYLDGGFKVALLFWYFQTNDINHCTLRKNSTALWNFWQLLINEYDKEIMTFLY